MEEGCFIKKIFLRKQDKSVHAQFVRFGKGVYSGRAILNLIKTSKIKIKSSFEFANDFVRLVAGLASKLKISGVVLSKEDISGLMSKKNINGNSETKKGGLFYENTINEQEVDSEIVMELVDNSYFTLLNIEADGISLKIKPKLPKPGKSGEGKIDDKFCSLEADLKYWQAIKEFFFWDVPECSKCKISHEYYINELVMPENEKDFKQIRIKTKRKGKLVRRIVIGKDSEQVKECEFEA